MTPQLVTEELRAVDLTGIKFGQGVTAVALCFTFVAGTWPLALVVGAVNLAGSLTPRLNAMPWLYRAIGIRAGLRPRIVADDPQPHRFAQGFSGTVTLAGAVTVALGAPAAGWPAVLLVAALAVLNITVGFCAGCFTYLQLRRIGIVGRTA